MLSCLAFVHILETTNLISLGVNQSEMKSFTTTFENNPIDSFLNWIASYLFDYFLLRFLIPCQIFKFFIYF